LRHRAPLPGESGGILLPVCALLCCSGMTIKQQLRQYLGEKNARRMSRAMPFMAGAAVAFALGNMIRDRGVRGLATDLKNMTAKDEDSH